MFSYIAMGYIYLLIFEPAAHAARLLKFNNQNWAIVQDSKKEWGLFLTKMVEKVKIILGQYCNENAVMKYMGMQASVCSDCTPTKYKYS